MTIYKCRECGSELDYMNVTAEVTEYGTYSIEDWKEEEHFYAEDINDTETTEARCYCPECDYEFDSFESSIEEVNEDDDEETEEVIVEETLRVGDRVTIRNDLSANSVMGMYGLRVNERMLDFRGVSFLITAVIRNSMSVTQYKLDIPNDDWFWTSKMFEGSTIQDMSFSNDDFSVSIINNKILIADFNGNVLEFPMEKLEYLLNLDKDIQSISDGEDTIELIGKHDKLIELMEKIKNGI